MADSDTTQEAPQQDQTQRGHEQFDSIIEQMAGATGYSPTAAGFDLTHQVVTSYFEQVEAQTRQARKMADLWAQSLILQQTTGQIVSAVVPLVTAQVIKEIRRDPSLVKRFDQQQSEQQ